MQNKAPERIWLTPFTPEVFESDWKHYKRFDGEIEYIRADLVERTVAEKLEGILAFVENSGFDFMFMSELRRVSNIVEQKLKEKP